VTFATYPAAMPGGAVCHLRGSLGADEDAGFARAKDVCAWVDCVEGRVEHEEFLPREGLKKVDVRAEELAAAKGEIEKLKAQIVMEQRAAEFARAYAKKLQDEAAQGADGKHATWLKMQAKLEGELAKARGWCWAFAILSVVLILIGAGIYWGAVKVAKVDAPEASAVVETKEEVAPVKVEVVREVPRKVEEVEAPVKTIEIKEEVPRDGARAPNPLCNGPAERPMAKRGTKEEEEEKPRLSIRAAEEVPRKKRRMKTMGEELFQNEAKGK
jgi:hypothetical protein